VLDDVVDNADASHEADVEPAPWEDAVEPEADEPEAELADEDADVPPSSDDADDDGIDDMELMRDLVRFAPREILSSIV
jgi:hypothetical protein